MFFVRINQLDSRENMLWFLKEMIEVLSFSLLPSLQCLHAVGTVCLLASPLYSQTLLIEF